MIHKHAKRKLNRKTGHRLALIRNLCNSLLRYDSIRTTLAKAKELKREVEPIITLAKKNKTHTAKRRAFDILRNRLTVTRLFNEVSPRYTNRPGGYVSVLKDGYRPGDNAPMALVRLLDVSSETLLKHEQRNSREQEEVVEEE